MIYLTYELIRAWLKYADHAERIQGIPWLTKLSSGEPDYKNIDFNHEWKILFGADEESQSITRPKTILITPTLSSWPNVEECHGPITAMELLRAYVTVEISIIVGGPSFKFREDQGGSSGGGQNRQGAHLLALLNLYKGAFQTATLAAGVIDTLVTYKDNDPAGSILTQEWSRARDDPDEGIHHTDGMRIMGEQPDYLKGRIVESEFVSEQWGVAEPGPTPVFITKTFNCLIERGPFK